MTTKTGPCTLPAFAGMTVEGIWPYWVVRQFDPLDDAFVPRAFSLTQINLSHRNWTAVGLPDIAELPLVDPRGLVTPFFDGDGWKVNGSWIVELSEKPERHRFSEYGHGDVFRGLPEATRETSISCHVGMASAAALFLLEPGIARTVIASIPLHEKEERPTGYFCSQTGEWDSNGEALWIMKRFADFSIERCGSQALELYEYVIESHDRTHLRDESLWTHAKHRIAAEWEIWRKCILAAENRAEDASRGGDRAARI